LEAKVTGHQAAHIAGRWLIPVNSKGSADV